MPGSPVAVKVTGEPVRPAHVAVRVLAPATVPSFQLPTVAMPEASDTADAPVTEPPPEATANVTVTPATGSFLTSLTMTLGAMLTAAPRLAVWPSPAFRAIWVAAGTLYVYLSAATRALVPHLVVTRTFTLPLPAGTVTVSLVADFTRTRVADVLSKVTFFTRLLPLRLKFLPVMVTVLPPAFQP